MDKLNNYKFSKFVKVEIGRLIFNGDFQIGMTKEMCRLSWGEPKDINRTITKYSTSEQWVYDVVIYILKMVN